MITMSINIINVRHDGYAASSSLAGSIPWEGHEHADDGEPGVAGVDGDAEEENPPSWPSAGHQASRPAAAPGSGEPRILT